jgi:hypothetical protein
MPVISVSRWSSDKPDAMKEAARESKKIYEKHGARGFHFSRIHAGQETGQWVVAIYFDNWESYGKVQAALAHDSEYQALFAKVEGFAKLTSRMLSVEVDL